MRRWALWVAVAAVLLAVLACVGAGFIITPPPLGERLTSLLADPASLPDGVDASDVASLDQDSFAQEVADPPGLGIPYLALPLGLLLVILILMVLPLIIGHRAVALVNGIVSVVTGLVATISGIVMAVVAVVALTVMVGLLLAVPFGTLAYLAIFGFFDTGTSAVVLGLVMALLLTAAVFLVVADQRVLASKRLVFFLLLAALLTLVTTILHSIVPVILVSITDAVAAILTAVVGAVWGLAMLIGGVIALIKQLQLGRQSGGPLRTAEASALPSAAPAEAPPAAPPTAQPSGSSTRTEHGERAGQWIVSRLRTS